MKKVIACLFACFTLLCAQTLVVSEREGFYNGKALSEHSVRKLIDFECPYDGRDVTDNEWYWALKWKRVAVLVHGFNQNYENSTRFFSELMESIEKSYDVCICYMWPGGRYFSDYYFAKRQVESGAVADRLGRLLDDISNKALSVDIIAHSMGGRLSLEALKLPDVPKIRNLFLLAPAVSDKTFEKGKEYYLSAEATSGVYIFHSDNDAILSRYYPLMEWEPALGSYGPINKEALPDNVHIYDCSEHITHHHSYIESEHIASIIDELIHPYWFLRWWW